MIVKIRVPMYRNNETRATHVTVERERERETETETETDRDRETDRQTDRQTERQLSLIHISEPTRRS